jgi:hypothetical protein
LIGGIMAKTFREIVNEYKEKEKEKDTIEEASDKLAKTLESTSIRVGVLGCQKYLLKQGYQVVRIT